MHGNSNIKIYSRLVMHGNSNIKNILYTCDARKLKYKKYIIDL